MDNSSLVPHNGKCYHCNISKRSAYFREKSNLMVRVLGNHGPQQESSKTDGINAKIHQNKHKYYEKEKGKFVRTAISAAFFLETCTLTDNNYALNWCIFR